MALASPAIHAARPSGWIDLRRPAEYPIVLGESLKESSDSKDQLLTLRYNWQPKAGFLDRQSSLTATDKKYRLAVEDAEDDDADPFVYSGHVRPITDNDKTSSLALIFDKKKSVFVLEAISASLDLNLKSAPGQSTEDVRAFPQLSSTTERVAATTNGTGKGESIDDDTPDPSNPFDFRHFLTEARENVEKAQQPGGGRTPIPGARTPTAGSRTPLSGFGSPLPATNRFLSTTPQFRPTPTSAPSEKKWKPEEVLKKSKTASPMPQKATKTERKSIKPTHQPLSKEKVSDSDEELSDTITVTHDSHLAESRPNGHTRNISGGFGRSPHIVVNDGDLEIDMGSPPPEIRRSRIDPGAFRSNSGTPVVGLSSKKRAPVEEDIQMRDREDNPDDDGDVEELELGSPKTSHMSIPGSGDVSMVDLAEEHEHEHAPTPPNQALDDDDEDELAAELEAALAAEDNENEAAYRSSATQGLGITGTNQGMEDDESEVSEEE